MPHEASSFYQDFYPRGLRKFCGIGIICLTSLIPALTVWKEGPEQVPLHQPAFGRGFPGTRGFGRPAWGGNNEPQKSTIPWGLIGRTLLASFGGVVGLAIYYPAWGFKRYALLCGPTLGLGSMMLLDWYLGGRTKIYRFEGVFAALIGAFPGVVLYALLARRKWHKKHPADAIWLS